MHRRGHGRTGRLCACLCANMPGGECSGGGQEERGESLKESTAVPHLQAGSVPGIISLLGQTAMALLIWGWLQLLPALSDLSLFQCHLLCWALQAIYCLNTGSVRKGVPPVPASHLAGTMLWPVLARECVWKQVFSEVVFCMGALLLFFLLRIERLQRKTPNLSPCSSSKVLLKAGNSQHPQYNHPLAERLIAPTLVWKAQGMLHPHAAWTTAKKCTFQESKSVDILNKAFSFLVNSFSHNSVWKPDHKLCLTEAVDLLFKEGKRRRMLDLLLVLSKALPTAVKLFSLSSISSISPFSSTFSQWNK